MFTLTPRVVIITARPPHMAENKQYYKAGPACYLPRPLLHPEYPIMPCTPANPGCRGPRRPGDLCKIWFERAQRPVGGDRHDRDLADRRLHKSLALFSRFGDASRAGFRPQKRSRADTANLYRAD